MGARTRQSKGKQKEKKQLLTCQSLHTLVRFWDQRSWDTSASTPGFLAAGNLAWGSTTQPEVRVDSSSAFCRDEVDVS